MKRDKGLIIAGAAGLFALLGFWAVRRLLHGEDCQHYYGDFHHLFNNFTEEDCHGVEYFSVR